LDLDDLIKAANLQGGIDRDHIVHVQVDAVLAEGLEAGLCNVEVIVLGRQCKAEDAVVIGDCGRGDVGSRVDGRHMHALENGAGGVGDDSGDGGVDIGPRRCREAECEHQRERDAIQSVAGEA
jgi:hypothetical protein